MQLDLHKKISTGFEVGELPNLRKFSLDSGV